jgi:hypothetical protein
VTIEIPLTRGYVTVIDDEDWALAGGRRWTAAADPSRRTIYAVGKVNGKAVYLHRLLCPEWEYVDHADGDGLNNCRYNLRDGTGFRNGANKVMLRNNTSGYKGVGWNKRKRKWVATIAADRKRIHLGYHATAEAAANAYDKAAVNLFGEYAKTNAVLAQATAPAGDWRHNPPEEQTHCRLAGHEYTPENTYINTKGKRECRECRKIRAASRDRRVPNPRPGGRFCSPGCTCRRHRRAK